MGNQFHKNLDRMALFTVLVTVAVVLCRGQILSLALHNVWLNGIIIGTTVFGVGLCFVNVFKLVPEYRWMRRYFTKQSDPKELPPGILRPVATMLNTLRGQKRGYISSQTMNNFLEMIMGRFEDNRESVRYITNTLIFLGLLGTFWGLIQTVGGFAELISIVNFDDPNVMDHLQDGLATPLSGMGTAFASSILGLAGSLIVGFLGLQAQLAQNALIRELEESLSEQTKLFGYLAPGARGEETALPYVNAAAKELTKAVDRLEKTINKTDVTVCLGGYYLPKRERGNQHVKIS